MKKGDVVWSNASAQYYLVDEEIDFGAAGVNLMLTHIEDGRGNRQSIEVVSPPTGMDRVIVSFVGFVHVGKLGR